MPKMDKAQLFVGKKWMLLAIVLCLLDQISKSWIVKTIPYHTTKTIFPGLQFVYSTNRGIAFSFLNQQPQWGMTILITFILLISLVIGVWLLRTPSSQRWEGISLALILGGAMGNIIDRIWHGHVIDFIDLHYQSYHWYTFNLADVFITVGALMLLRNIICESATCQMKKS